MKKMLVRDDLGTGHFIYTWKGGGGEGCTMGAPKGKWVGITRILDEKEVESEDIRGVGRAKSLYLKIFHHFR